MVVLLYLKYILLLWCFFLVYVLWVKVITIWEYALGHLQSSSYSDKISYLEVAKPEDSTQNNWEWAVNQPVFVHYNHWELKASTHMWKSEADLLRWGCAMVEITVLAALHSPISFSLTPRQQKIATTKREDFEHFFKSMIPLSHRRRKHCSWTCHNFPRDNVPFLDISRSWHNKLSTYRAQCI